MSQLSDLLCKSEQEILFADIDTTDMNDIMSLDPISDVNDFNNIVDHHLQHTTPTIISNDEYDGPFNFEVSIIPSGKNPWVYSPSLKKIFIDMGNPFPIDFKLSDQPNYPLFVRVMPVFSLPQHYHELVYRCLSHEHHKEKFNQNILDHVRQHIIRCENANATYEGNRMNNERLSIVIPLTPPQTGSDSVREMFFFVCKSSCPTGMNRRPIEVIFTLENISGEVLGRKVMNVRICSCPKRDKEKEEKEINKPSQSGGPHGKKRKREKGSMNSMHSQAVDTMEYNMNLTILGSSNAQSVLKYCHDLMAGEVIRNSGTHAEIPFRKCLDLLSSQMDNKNFSDHSD